MKKNIAVVRLDNPNSTNLSGTILEITDDGVLSTRARYTDKDGQLPQQDALAWLDELGLIGTVWHA